MLHTLEALKKKSSNVKGIELCGLPFATFGSMKIVKSPMEIFF
jgi:hypothetical protein